MVRLAAPVDAVPAHFSSWMRRCGIALCWIASAFYPAVPIGDPATLEQRIGVMETALQARDDVYGNVVQRFGQTHHVAILASGLLI